MQTNVNKEKVVIIGAGPAGITAARELVREPDKYDVTVLEESDVVGGISRTVRHGENRIDIVLFSTLNDAPFFTLNGAVSA